MVRGSLAQQRHSSLISRRRLLQSLAASFGGVAASPWAPALAHAARDQSRHCILLWMVGGPSQTDTFDMKPAHANGGEFKEVATNVPGLRFSEHLPRLARQADQLAVIRGMSTDEGDHGRGTYLMRTGRRPQGEIRFPTLGSLLSKQLEDDASALPSFVSVNPSFDFNPAAYQAGFLGPRYAPLNVAPKAAQAAAAGFSELGVDNLQPQPGVAPSQVAARLGLLNDLQAQMSRQHPAGPTQAHNATLQRAIRLMNSDSGKVFDLSEEPATVREKYGPSTFGQGCLLARRLIEQGVSFVEVSLGDFGRWDTHTNNFPAVQQLSAELDAGWSALMEELGERGLLDSTTILWMGEFGRTPQINGSAGRDHYPQAWSAVLAGGGIRGGQAYGRTSPDGRSVEEGMTDVADLLATVCAAMSIDHQTQNVSDVGRPFRISEGTPIQAVLES